MSKQAKECGREAIYLGWVPGRGPAVAYRNDQTPILRVGRPPFPICKECLAQAESYVVDGPAKAGDKCRM